MYGLPVSIDVSTLLINELMLLCVDSLLCMNEMHVACLFVCCCCCGGGGGGGVYVCVRACVRA